jgi:hypothetical protein
MRRERRALSERFAEQSAISKLSTKETLLEAAKEARNLTITRVLTGRGGQKRPESCGFLCGN